MTLLCVVIVRRFNHTNQVSTIQAVIQEDETGKLWKLIIGMNEQSGWQGVHYPNSTTDTCCFGAPQGDPEACPAHDPCPPMGMEDCLDGCLYEVCDARLSNIFWMAAGLHVCTHLWAWTDLG